MKKEIPIPMRGNTIDISNCFITIEDCVFWKLRPGIAMEKTHANAARREKRGS